MALLERFELADRAKDKVEALSLGNQQRVQIAAAVIAQPAVLILDEPFSGLDPVAVDAMVDLLREEAARGVPVLFSSHQLDLVERVCDDLVILAHGKVVAAGTDAELRSRGATRHRLVAGSDVGWIRDLPDVTVLDVDGNTALLQLADPHDSTRIVREALSRGDIQEFAEVRPTLSEIYREVTR